MQIDQVNRYSKKNKRIYEQLKDNAGPAPKNSRRRT